MKWTNSQQIAINARNNNILVSAAAGSGKTAVLTERVVRLVTDEENPVNIDRLIIVTFTKAAAHEMRSRIQKRLSELANTCDEALRYRVERQLLLLDSTRISTIHGFCTEILRMNFHEVDLNADFIVADDKEMELLLGVIIENVLNERYADEDNASFLQLVEALSTEKSDRLLHITLKKLYSFARNHAFYSDWLESELEHIHKNSDSNLINSTCYVQLIKPRLLELLSYGEALCEDMHSLCVEHGGDMEALYLDFTEKCKFAVNELRELVISDDWDKLYYTLEDGKILPARLPTPKKSMEIDEGYRDSFKGLRDELKALLEGDVKKLVCITTQQYEEDLKTTSVLTRELFDMVKRLDLAFSRAKRIRRRVDFSDLEQLALELVYNKEHNMLGISPVARSVASGISEIMVDEYQDTNDAQEKLFRAITDKNLFMVGDVKQSIYRFREARPENFLEKRQSFTPTTNAEVTDFAGLGEGIRIDLSENFRTHSSVTDFINYVCKNLFSESIGEMKLQNEDMLVPKGIFTDTCSSGVELLLAVNKEYIPAMVVAARIKELLTSDIKIDYVSVSGEKVQRSIAPSDICILMRSRTHMEEYVTALADMGISAFSDANDGFITTPEIYPIVCFIKLIINPKLEFEMYSVLKSYLYKMSDDELAKVFNENRQSPIRRLMSCDIPEVKKFLRDINILRKSISRPSVTQCIEFYNDLIACDVDTTQLFGELESMGNSLHGFLEYLPALRNTVDCEYLKRALQALESALRGDFETEDTEISQLSEFVKEKSVYTAVELICGELNIGIPECVKGNSQIYSNITVTQILKNENNMYVQQIDEIPKYILSYFRCMIDNSRLDDIYNVLISDLYGVGEDTLKELLRLGSASLYSWIAKKYDNGEKSTITAFYECLSYLRAESAYRLPSELLRMLYELTGAEESVMSLGNGNQRLQNLRLFIDYADTYGNDIQSLYNAICRIENMGIGDMRPAKPADKTAVSIMTIHGSKGLEFPVVVLAEMDSKFGGGGKGERPAIVLNADYGAAFKVRENSGLTEHKTMGYVALEMENKRAELSEELRLLYVSMTRAKQLLILSAKDVPDKNGYTKLEKTLKNPYRPAELSPARVSLGGSMYSWILDVLLVGVARGGEHIGDEFSLVLGNGSKVAVKKVDGTSNFTEVYSVTEDTEYIYEYKDTIADALSYNYISVDSAKDIKYSVSQLVAKNELEQYYFVRKPKILTNTEHSPSERGTAVHRFLQYVNLNNMPKGIADEIGRLVIEQFISKEQANMLNIAELERFFASELGARVVSAERVLREPRFMHRYTRTELVGLIGELAPDVEGAILQGAADCVLFENGGIVIIDYKTDRVKNVGELCEKYKNQLRIYGDILARVYGTKVKELIIYSIYLGESISVVCDELDSVIK